MEQRQVGILFVCLGNICRSPTAEAVLRVLAARDAPELKLTIDSAGTAGYHIGSAPDTRAQQAARRRGYDMSGLRARVIATPDFERFDFILAMDRDNLSALQRVAPPGVRGHLRLFLESVRSTVVGVWNLQRGGLGSVLEEQSQVSAHPRRRHPLQRR